MARISCIGSNLESFESLKFLVESGCEIQGLITLPAGRSQNVSDYYDLHPFCESHGIQTIDTVNVNSEETVEAVKSLKPDYLFTLGWSQIFREDFIRCFSQFVVGTHPSKLPYGRGRAPLPWTIIEGLTESAISFFKIDTGVDTGMLIAQREFKIAKDAYVSDLYATVARELSLGFLEIYQQIQAGSEFEFTRQSEEGVTVRGKRTPSDGFIGFDRPAEEVERLIRAVSKPYPGAYCYYKDEKIVFWKVSTDRDQRHSGTLGQVLSRGEDGILVRFADANLWLREPAFEDGSPVDLKFFRLGDKLGYNIQDEIYKLKKSQQ